MAEAPEMAEYEQLTSPPPDPTLGRLDKPRASSQLSHLTDVRSPVAEASNEEEEDLLHGVTISKDMILHGVSKADSRRGMNESLEAYLGRLTHLSLTEKNIAKINLLRMTPGLRVLYLYDNVIMRMCDLDPLTKLTHLYLQNNIIEKIEGLGRLVNLEKLYLNGNKIQMVEGLEKCTRLEELHVSGQKLEEDQELRFNPGSMEAVGTSLMVLNAGNSNVRDVSPLQDLLCLKNLNLEGSRINSIAQLQPILENCKYLKELDIRESKLCKMPKHREHITLLSESLSLLNNKEIRQQERSFLIELQMRRMKMGRSGAAAAAANAPAAGPGPGGVSSSGFDGASIRDGQVGALQLQRQGPRGGKVLSGKGASMRKGSGWLGQGFGGGDGSGSGSGEGLGHVQWGAGFPAHVR